MYITFDIGGTKTRIGISKDGKSFENIISFATPKDFEEGMGAIEKHIKDLMGNAEITAMAGGIAGPLDKEKTMAVGGPNISGWHNKPLKEELSKILGVPVHLENDAAMGTLGEANFGAGKGKKVVVYMTISTGVGGARTVDGVLDPSAMGYEPGWQIIDASETLCSDDTCVGKKYLIHHISGADIERHTGKKPYEITDTDFWDNEAHLLAYGLHNIAVIWSPDIIVLGGSMMKEIGIPIEAVRSYTKKEMQIFPEIPEIAHAKLGDELGLYGALAFLKQQEK